MIEPDFLNVPELAARWKATPRQILEYGGHLRLPILFQFSGLAFRQADRRLMGHGATDEQRELETKRESVARIEAHLKRNAAGLTDEFSRLDKQQIIDLRQTILEYERRMEELEDMLRLREAERRRQEYLGYMRLPPRAILEILDQGEIPFPYLAFHPHSRLHLANADGRPYVDGEIMALEPGVDGKWKSRLTVDDLLIPMIAIKHLEASTSASEPATRTAAKHLPRSIEQERVVLEELRAQGYDPTANPKGEPGKPGARSAVWQTLKTRKDLFVSQGVFNKTWERLRSSGEIVDKED